MNTNNSVYTEFLILFLALAFSLEVFNEMFRISWTSVPSLLMLERITSLIHSRFFTPKDEKLLKTCHVSRP